MWKLLLVLSCAVALSHSQTKTFIREYTYTAGEADSKITSRAIALDQVKRILLEEIGVYLQSEMTMIKEEKNLVYNELSKQQIQSITAGITETKIVEEKWNGEKYYIKASISVDPNEVNRNIARIGADQSKLKELEDVRRKADEAYVEIERLRKELTVAKSDVDRSARQKEYNVASNTLSAFDWLLRGFNAYESKDYDKAISFYQKAIDLDPDYPDAYNNQGIAKLALNDNQGAVADYTIAIKLKPDFAEAYYDRGTAKLLLDNFAGAISDLAKAIELKPDWAELYYNRGNARRGLEDYQGAVADYTKAISLKPDWAYPYNNRGLANLMLGEKRSAKSDFIRAMELGQRVPQNILDMCK